MKTMFIKFITFCVLAQPLAANPFIIMQQVKNPQSIALVRAAINTHKSNAGIFNTNQQKRTFIPAIVLVPAAATAVKGVAAGTIILAAFILGTRKEKDIKSLEDLIAAKQREESFFAEVRALMRKKDGATSDELLRLADILSIPNSDVINTPINNAVHNTASAPVLNSAPTPSLHPNPQPSNPIVITSNTNETTGGSSLSSAGTTIENGEKTLDLIKKIQLAQNPGAINPSAGASSSIIDSTGSVTSNIPSGAESALKAGNAAGTTSSMISDEIKQLKELTEKLDQVIRARGLAATINNNSTSWIKTGFGAVGTGVAAAQAVDVAATTTQGAAVKAAVGPCAQSAWSAASSAGTAVVSTIVASPLLMAVTTVGGIVVIDNVVKVCDAQIRDTIQKIDDVINALDKGIEIARVQETVAETEQQKEEAHSRKITLQIMRAGLAYGVRPGGTGLLIADLCRNKDYIADQVLHIAQSIDAFISEVYEKYKHYEKTGCGTPNFGQKVEPGCTLPAKDPLAQDIKPLPNPITEVPQDTGCRVPIEKQPSIHDQIPHNPPVVKDPLVMAKNNDKEVAEKPRIANSPEDLAGTMKDIKKDYERDNQKDVWRLKENGTPIQKDVFYVAKDCRHYDIEAYNESGDHLGSIDPKTKKFYKPPVKGRKI